MAVSIKPSDLYYKYARKKATRDVAKFAGKPDAHPFDRDDLYEVIPMLEAVMDALALNAYLVMTGELEVKEYT